MGGDDIMSEIENLVINLRNGVYSPKQLTPHEIELLETYYGEDWETEILGDTTDYDALNEESDDDDGDGYW